MRAASQNLIAKIFVCTVSTIILGLLVAKLFFIGSYRIPQNGMFPTLPAGSHVFTLRRAYSNPASVKRGDIVVFEREENGRRYDYVWRVVGLPGEKIETSGESLVINGQPAQRQRLREADGKTIYQEQIGNISYQIALDEFAPRRPADVSVTVPPDEFFVMGDNRFDARDSRFFGAIPFNSIIGKKL